MTELNLLGRTIGRFEILSELGRGGMAVVYRARQTSPNRIVALKVLPPELSYDKSYIARFHQEADSVAALEHPHIVPIYAVDEAEGYHYIAMKYITGRTLKEVVQERGALDIAYALDIIDQVGEALDYAHSNGVIHRDIKPSNMMLEQNGWVYLTDFGLARGGAAGGGLTMAGTVMGTPEYMSPEQAQGLPTIGPATDIYALGVVLYELLTGQMPFHADTPMGMLVARLQFAPKPPRDHRGDLPIAVEDVIMRALARKPEARFHSAADMVAALRSATGISGKSGPVLQQPITPMAGVPVQPMTPPPPIQSPSQGTPPYVIPSNNPNQPPVARPDAQGATFVAPTIPLGKAPIGGAATSAAPPTPLTPAKPGSRTGLFIGIGVAVFALIAVIAGVLLFSGPRVDPRVTQNLKAGQEALGQKGGFDRALAAYQQVLKIEPKNAAAHTQIALIYLLRERYKDAEQAARAAIEAKPESAHAQAILAEALNSQSNYDDGLQAADKAIQLDAQLAIGYAARAMIRADKAIRDTDTGLLDQAISDADRAISLSNGKENLQQAIAHNVRGYVYWQEFIFSNDRARAASGGDEFNRAIGLQDQIAVFYSNLGYFYNAQGAHAQSIDDTKLAQASFDLARAQFEKAQDADPQYAHAHTGLGWNLYYLKDYAGALAEFDQAIEINPQDTDAYIGKSYAYQYQETANYQGSLEELNKAAKITPRNPQIFATMGWAYISQAFTQADGSAEKTRSYEDAAAQFQKAIELNARYVNALTGMGWTLSGQAYTLSNTDLYAQAIEILEQSLQIKEEQSTAHFGVGWAYYLQGIYDQAEEPFRRAVELSPNDGGNHYWLGLTLKQLDRNDEARESFEIAVEKGNSYAQQELDALK